MEVGGVGSVSLGHLSWEEGPEGKWWEWLDDNANLGPHSKWRGLRSFQRVSEDTQALVLGGVADENLGSLLGEGSQGVGHGELPP